MQIRQIVAVLVGFIVILAAALFVVTWSGDDDDPDAAPTTTTAAPASTTSTTSTSTTTTSTTIPLDCTFESNNADDDSTDDDSANDDSANDDSTDDDSADDEVPLVPTLGTNSSVSTVGLDTVHFGMTVNQAETAAGSDLIACSLVSDCYHVTPRHAPKGISFVVHAGTIERVDIGDGAITTRSGLGIGTDEAEITAAFGEQLERADNGDGSVDLIFVPRDESDAEFRVIFTVRDGVVETFRSGRIPLVLERTPCA